MRQRLTRWKAPLLVAAGVLAHAGLRQPLSRCDPSTVPAARDEGLRVVVWNLRNFPGDHDLPRIRARLEQLDPQVLALQEVLDPAALVELRPGFRWQASAFGGRNGQRLVIGWDPEAVALTDVREHDELTMGGRVRPAFSGYVRAHGSGPDFHLVLVHLKATRNGHDVRRQQWPRLADVVRSRVEQGGSADDDVIVVGDFNVAGGPGCSSAAELERLATALAPADLRLWETVGDCTAYWDGRRRDAWWEPSRLDLVWSRGLAEVPESGRRAWPGAHCAQHACEPFSASEHHPEPDMHGISDHCPIVIDLPARDDDP